MDELRDIGIQDNQTFFYNKMIIFLIIAFRFSKKPFMLWKWLVFIHFITMQWGWYDV